MTYESYLENVSKKLKYNFDFIEIPEFDGVKFSLAAKSNIRNERFFATKGTVIYAYENNEYCFIRIMDDITLEGVDETFDVLKKAMDDFVKPNNEHMSTVFTGIMLTMGKLEAELEDIIKKFKYQKSYKFGLHGWTSIRLVVVEIGSGRVISSREAKKISKFYKPF
ncbi:MAG TPA: hypothetical protein DDX29_09525 [Clostridiales bacterium]|nr:hypothetical protein [Clostridiales bacterium]